MKPERLLLLRILVFVISSYWFETHVDLNIISLPLCCLLAILALEDRSAVSVELKGGDNDIRGVDANVRGRAVCLVAGDTFNVDYPLLTVHLGDLALPTFVFPADDADLVVLADGERSDLQ